MSHDYHKLLSLKGPYLLNRELDNFLLSEDFTAMRDGNGPIGSYAKIDHVHGKRVHIIIDENTVVAHYIGEGGAPVDIFKENYCEDRTSDTPMESDDIKRFIEVYNKMVWRYTLTQAKLEGDRS